MAEFAETRGQADFLAAERCQLAQGFLLSDEVSREQLMGMPGAWRRPIGSATDRSNTRSGASSRNERCPPRWAALQECGVVIPGAHQLPA